MCRAFVVFTVILVGSLHSLREYKPTSTVRLMRRCYIALILRFRPESFDLKKKRQHALILLGVDAAAFLLCVFAPRPRACAQLLFGVDIPAPQGIPFPLYACVLHLGGAKAPRIAFAPPFPFQIASVFLCKGFPREDLSLPLNRLRVRFLLEM